MKNLAARLALALLGATVALVGVTAAGAQTAFPNKPIRLVVPFPPGGGGDAVARSLAPYLKNELGQPVVLDNVPGASGNLGANLVVRAPADGYTVLLGASTLATNPHLSKLAFDPLTDLRPIARMAVGSLVVVVHPSVKASNLRELIALSRKSQINYGTPGLATPMHLAGELLNRKAGGAFAHVPYKGSGAALNDLLGGQIEMMITSLSTVNAHIKAGKLKGIALLSEKRSPQALDLPTAREQGVNVVTAIWYGFFVPAATPDAIVARLEDAFRKCSQTPGLIERYVDAGIDPDFVAADGLAKILRSEHEQWGKLIRDARITVE